MDPRISAGTYDQFFGYAPFVIGLIIYGAFYFAKRKETGDTGMPIGQTFACATCGRRGVREHMVPQEHAGAVSWYCSKCAGAH